MLHASMFQCLFYLVLPQLLLVASQAVTGSTSPSKAIPVNGTSTSYTSATPGSGWPTAIFPTFPPQFSDIPQENLDCWKSWGNYRLRAKVSNPGIIATPTTTDWVSTYPTPITSIWTSTVASLDSASKHPIGVTTLCDGFPRAQSASWEWFYSTKSITRTYTYSTTFSRSTIPGITRSGYENVWPTCSVAPNDSPLCEKVNSAYSWWLTATATQTSSPDPTRIPYLETPVCRQIVAPAPGATPLCYFGPTPVHEIYYWPTPTPSGTDFCNSNWTAPTGTPTKPGYPNTAVVSGHTLTSPTVYHFFKNVTLNTLFGTRSRADGGYIPTKEVWSPLTPAPTQTVFTVAQLERDLLSASSRYSSRRRKYIYEYSNNFKINDIFTIRAEAWFGKRLGNATETTIWQHEVEPTLAVLAEDFAKQNKILEDCVWKSRDTRSTERAYIRQGIPTANFHPIITEEAPEAVRTPEPGAGL